MVSVKKVVRLGRSRAVILPHKYLKRVEGDAGMQIMFFRVSEENGKLVLTPLVPAK